MTLDDAQLAVSRGVAFLNFNVERWRKRIEIKDFDITSFCHCIIGQIAGTGKNRRECGSYFDKLEELFHGHTFERSRLYETHGFDCPTTTSGADWNLLQAAWLEVLNAS